MKISADEYFLCVGYYIAMIKSLITEKPLFLISLEFNNLGAGLFDTLMGFCRSALPSDTLSIDHVWRSSIAVNLTCYQ